MVKVVEAIEVDPDGIRRARLLSRLSGRELGRRTGVHSNFISRLERGLIQEIDRAFFDSIIEALRGEGDFKDKDRGAVERVIGGELRFRFAPSEGRGLLMIFRQRFSQMAPSMAA